MASDNRLDRLFRQKLEERQLSFDPSYWEAAEVLILAQERRRRKRRFVWWFFASTGLLLAGFSIWYLTGRIAVSGPVPETPVPSKEMRMKEPVATVQARDGKRHSPETWSAESRSWPAGASGAPQKRTIVPASAKPSGHTGPDPGSSAGLKAATTLSETAESAPPTAVADGSSRTRTFVAPVDPFSAGGFSVKREEPGHAMTPAGASFRMRLAQEVQLGAAWSPASGNQPGFTGGLGINLFVNPQWGIGFGLSYYREGAGRAMVIGESPAVEFGFGRSETTYSLQPQTLHFLESPAIFFYQKARHRVELGGVAGYLLGARGKLQTASVGALDTIPVIKILGTGWLETKDLSSWQAHLTAGYRYRLSPYLSLGTRIQYRAGNLQDGEARPGARWRGQIQLTYHLVR